MMRVSPALVPNPWMTELPPADLLVNDAPRALGYSALDLSQAFFWGGTEDWGKKAAEG